MHKPLIFVGDIHGNWPLLRYNLERKKITDSVIIQVGDFGAYGKKYEVELLEVFNSRIKKSGNVVYAIRGNHDNPAVWNDTAGWPKQSHVHFVPDYTVLELCGKRIGFWGGAHSLNRAECTEGKDWWKDETIVFDDEKLKNFTNLDLLVQHTVSKNHSPLAGQPPSDLLKYYTNIDPKLNDDLEEQHKNLECYLKRIKEQSPNLTHVIHGDYHISKSTIVDGIHIKALGIDEFYAM